MTMNSTPHKARPMLGDDAWWYEADKSIEVYIVREGGPTLACRIERRHLLGWLKRTEPK